MTTRLLLLCLVATLCGCGLFAPGKPDAGSDPCVADPTVSITVMPASATMRPGDRLTFTWQIQSQRGTALAEPSISAGSLEGGGNNTVWLNAPPVPGTYSLDVTRVGCPADVGRATITVVPMADPGPAPGQQPVPTGVAWAPDGATVAVGGRGGVWRFRADGTFVDSLKLPHQGKVSVAFSPDGTLLAAGGDIAAATWLIRAEGLTPLGTLGGPGGAGVLWSHDGQELFIHKLDAIVAATVATGSVRVVSAVSTITQTTQSVPRLKFGPLGSLLVTVPGELRELSTGRRMTQWLNGAPLDGVAVAPDASWVFTSAGGVGLPFFSPPNSGGAVSFFSADLFSDGLLALGGTGAVRVVRVQGGAVVPAGQATLTSSPGTVLEVAWSPDGSKLAVAGSDRLYVLTRAALGL